MTTEFKLAALAIGMMTTFACGRAQWQETGANGPGTQDKSTQERTPLDPGNPPPVLAPVKPGHYPPAAFDSCKSQTLAVEVTTPKLNKSNLKDFWTTTARYPRVKVTLAAKKTTKTSTTTTFYLNADDARSRACQTQACAEQAGWSTIQSDLQGLNGVTVACVGATKPLDPPPPEPTPQESGSGEGRG